MACATYHAVKTGLLPGTTPARGRASRSDCRNDGEEARSDVHYRLSDWRALACWQPLQVQVGPQPQTSPHWHEAAGRLRDSGSRSCIQNRCRPRTHKRSTEWT